MTGDHVLVVGGAGYIGSHMVKKLLTEGCRVTTFDNLASGHRDAVLGGGFIEGDLADRAALNSLFDQQRIDGVMHFASYIEVGESVSNPGKYYANNVANTLNLLEAMVRHGVSHLLFSSSAAVYGDPHGLSIDERHPLEPNNPYGRTKWMVEQILEDYDRAYGLKSIRLRYFNAAGADPDGQLGERHEPETHLVPLVLQVASGRRPNITVNGCDYDTPDGTCIRDYIHVTDLCDAHGLAFARLVSSRESTVYNLGNGNGFSVQEVIEAARRVTNRPITVLNGPRRAGDPARLVADSNKARQELGWHPRFGAIETILEHAWRWEYKNQLE